MKGFYSGLKEVWGPQTKQPVHLKSSDGWTPSQIAECDGTNIHTANIIFTNIVLMAEKHNIPKGKMHSNCRLFPNQSMQNPHKETIRGEQTPVFQLSNFLK